MAELLIEHMPFTFRLEEASDGTGKLVARGQFALTDKPTQNKRLYREHLWRREFTRLNESIKARRCMGELDHPADGRTKLQRVSHVITGLKIEGNEVIGEAEVLDTPNGRILKALIKDGVQVGVSSRGYGSVKTNADGVQEVQEDFRLDTFDFVADPATTTAYPGIFTEERQHISEAENGLTIEVLREHYPGLLREAAADLVQSNTAETGRLIMEAEQRTEAKLKDQFAVSLRRSLERMEEDVRDRIRLELAKDNKGVEAIALMERIASMVKSFGGAEGHEAQAEMTELRSRLANKELEAQKLSAELGEAKKLAKEAAYALHLERAVADHPARRAIIELVGNVLAFESREALDKRIEAVKEELEARGHRPEPEVKSEQLAAKDTEIAELRDLISEKDSTIKEERAEVRRVKKLAERAIAASEQLQVDLHLERRLAEEHPHAKRIRGLCESADTTAEVDRLIENFVPPKTRRLDEDEASRIRARAQGAKGKERDLHEDTHGSSRTKPTNGHGGGAVPLLEGLGLDEAEFDRLAGVGKPS